MSGAIMPWNPEILEMSRRRFVWWPRLSIDVFGNVNLRFGRRLRCVWRAR